MKKAGFRILIFVIAILAGGIATEIFNDSWPAINYLCLVWVVTLLVWLVRWHAGAYAYQCSKCQSYFAITPWIDALSPHLMQSKLLRCPQCGHSDWFKEYPKKNLDTKSIHGGIITSNNITINRTLYFQTAIVLFIYLGLLIYSLVSYLNLPDQIMMLKNGAIVMRNKSEIMFLPAIAALTPILSIALNGFAARQGYRSAVYWVLTILFGVILIAFGLIQYSIISRAFAG